MSKTETAIPSDVLSDIAFAVNWVKSINENNLKVFKLGEKDLQFRW